MATEVFLGSLGKWTSGKAGGTPKNVLKHQFNVVPVKEDNWVDQKIFVEPGVCDVLDEELRSTAIALAICIGGTT